ncbi:MAG: nucleotidyltransferase family protein [Meiothermus sp.]|uniref:nucleotidyltransferase family protein n=1 Tax=Meiothermus sp. TaxID=1955249 RepID=UPI0025F91BC2|nr:nucleotidyltransferase family protein [Meiothermus sp.]MCS7195363.1 nucleotidyltransferase family protein [Meiothermus sp.]
MEPLASPLPLPEAELQALCRRYRVKRLSLFGSAARGELGPQSDVDLLVEFEPEAAVGFLTLARMARELSELFGRPVDLVPRSGLKPILRERVLREERVLYAS